MVAATFTVACSSAPPRPSVSAAAQSIRADTGATDEILASTVYAQLNQDPTYYFRHVDVMVDDGVAHLSGYVWSTDALYQARKIALKVPGITAVATNQLQLERNGKDTGLAR